MPSSYTSSLRLVLPVTGELTGTWGDTVNNGLTELVEDAIAGTAAVSMSDANYTLSVANEATDEARQAVVNLTGALTAQRDVICPAVSKLYIVRNNTTGGQSIRFKTSAGTGITVGNGVSSVLNCDGTNVLSAISSGVAAISAGGTGADNIADARANLQAAKSGANTDITSLAAPALGAATATTQAAKVSNTTVATTAFADRFRSLLSGAASGTLTVTDRGGLCPATSDVTVPAGVFSAGDVVTILNTLTSNITITQGWGLTMTLAGTASTGNRTMARSGLATVVFRDANTAVISGAGLS